MGMNVDDFTQPLEAVMAQERRFATPLSAEDRERLFADWREANAGALEEMEDWALAFDMMGRRVSARYLIEKERHEGSCRLVPIPFADQYGKVHTYSINNSDGSLLSRWLLSKFPNMNIETRKSVFDR